nr:MAG TPA: hypothetical protein [Caudoviricetes sp.]
MEQIEKYLDEIEAALYKMSRAFTVHNFIIKELNNGTNRKVS